MGTLGRWLCTWDALGATRQQELEQLYHSVIARYQEPHRRYHDTQHLIDCLDRVVEFKAVAEHFAEVELALWFHDSIYDRKGSNNEIQSAKWAHDSMLAMGLGAASANRVHALIMCTRHNVKPNGIDAEIVTDVDLGILGASPEKFALYEQQIREEYSWVPTFLFRRKRKAILENFLRRPRIYSTKLYCQRFDAQARLNLSHALAELHWPLSGVWCNLRQMFARLKLWSYGTSKLRISAARDFPEMTASSATVAVRVEDDRVCLAYLQVGDKTCAIIEFKEAVLNVIPEFNDEGLSRHPLYGKGLEYYSFHDLIEEDSADAVAPDKGGPIRRRFLISFHDGLVEVSTSKVTTLASNIDSDDAQDALTKVIGPGSNQILF